MRWNSLGGTSPRNTRPSVPRLTRCAGCAPAPRRRPAAAASRCAVRRGRAQRPSRRGPGNDVTVPAMTAPARHPSPHTATATEAVPDPVRVPGATLRRGDPAAPLASLRRDAARELWAVAAALALLAGVLAVAAGLGPDYVVKALLGYAFGAALIWRALGRRSHPHARFGAANRVTLARMALAAMLARCSARPCHSRRWRRCLGVVDRGGGHGDGAAGCRRRRAGAPQRPGQRLRRALRHGDRRGLHAAAVRVGVAGRPGRALGARGRPDALRLRRRRASWPWLAAPLPPSRRRQTVCVVQITTLIVCLGPVVPPELAARSQRQRGAAGLPRSRSTCAALAHARRPNLET
jgi:hypothetical protein